LLWGPVESPAPPPISPAPADAPDEGVLAAASTPVEERVRPG
jgi:hypothetical protein